jgi:coenzyme F420-reducing hydrogenase delta subunit
MADVRAFLASPARRAGEIVVVCCGHGAAALAPDVAAAGGVPYAVDCTGNLHTSVMEVLLRGGAGGVLVLACPSRDCWHREGPKWLAERVYSGREAELQERVPRVRVAVAHVNARERSIAVAAVRDFAARLASLGGPAVDDTLEVTARCEPAVADRTS